MPKINLYKIGSASMAAATGVIMSIAPVFAETTTTTTTTSGASVITIIINAATAAELASELGAQVHQVANVNDGDVEDVDDGEVEDANGEHPASASVTVKVTKANVVQTTAVAEVEND